MNTFDRVLQILELGLIVVCLIVIEIYSIRVKNLENELRTEVSAMRYEVTESEDRCRRLSYTCVDIVNRIVLEGGDYAE